ncbi:SusC/RagA family TonB-linked outer membrane protein [Arthrospiribacter ruber]|uniref:SusC/RagA family TonB-linked outer membrane protein n=1 Tax=Arthrospiribacter ruber TaxID=2487934 RepID=A0A951IVP4_9BACT|nr:SusC/RagA family TonB-linked outer membrane protein [Arthrospiribacter ruber]MBW3466458.1 SusC/RagA family TonB-linked outer membrane protein [Arthrospiribacter ruber]
MRKNFTLLIFLFSAFCLGHHGFGQGMAVSGNVTSQEDGMPLPGVSILVQGTNTGTVTDIDGNYSINVPSGNSVLTFSFIGFGAETVRVNNRSTVDVVMSPDTEQLGEVVVTAFGLTQEKKKISFSQQEVGSAEILASREQNVVDALNAKVAGVQVTRQGGSAGAGSSIVIRGIQSISGQNQPLFVVDGVPINNSFRASIGTSGGVDYANRAIDINPNDIESISVLKGPAATSLYGIQGATGVVLITTKKGSRKKGFTVDVSTNTSTDRIMNYFPGQLRYAQGDNGIYNGGTTFNHYGAPISTLRYDPSTPFAKDPNGTIVDMNHPNAGPRVPVYDNQRLFFQNGFTNDTHVAVSAGDEKSSFYLSAGNMYQEGIIPNNDFNRTSLKLSADSRLTEKFKIGGSVNYVNSTSTKFGRGDNFSDAIQGLYRTPPSFDNSAGFVYPSGVQRNFRGALDGSVPFSPDNPFWTVNNNPYTDNVNRFISFLQTEITPSDWLTITHRLGFDFSHDERTQIWAPSSSGGAAISASGALGGRIYEDTYTDRILNSDLILSATKDLSEDFSATFLVGHNMFSSSTSSLFMNGTNFAIPGLFNIANTQENPIFTKTDTRRMTQAVFSRASLGYLNSIFLELSVRNEWASTLPANNRSFTYGSAGLSVALTDLLKIDSRTLSFAKLRGSYAGAGNIPPAFSTDTFYNIATTSTRYASGVRFPIDGVGGVLLSSAAGNNNLRAEFTNTFEIGADIRLFENRIGLDVTYYNAVSQDQIVSVPVPASTGFTSQLTNAGEIQNKGIEAVLTSTILDRGDFSWDMIFNFTRNRNFVVSLPNDEPIVTNMFGARIQSRLIPGEQFGVFYGNGFLRNDNGDVLVNPQGFPMMDPEQIMVGNPNPDYLIGWRNNFYYKNFNLTMLWDIRKGGDIINVTAFWMGNGSGVAEHTLDRNKVAVFRGVIENPGGDNHGQVNDIPVTLDQAAFQGVGAANSFGRELTERWVQDGSWIRLRDVTLNYSFPSSIASRMGMSRASVGVYGRNLLLFTNYGGIDPETNLGGPNGAIGLDAFTTPNMRSYGLTINASF